MILVEVDLIKKGFKSSLIRFFDSGGNLQKIFVDNKAVVEKDGKYYLKCSEKEIPGAREITVHHRDIINE